MPSLHFQPPKAITKGTPLKLLMNAALVRLIGQSFQACSADFDAETFIQAATNGLEDLELTPRAKHIGACLMHALPSDQPMLWVLSSAAWGPNKQAPRTLACSRFFIYPTVKPSPPWDHRLFSAGMTACYEITQRFTAEFCLRPLLLSDQDVVIAQLHEWAKDPQPHVRRLVSEGTRPRLPWAPRLPNFIAEPQLSLNLLEDLRLDEVRYVQRSVANHLGDLAKDHLEEALDTAERWLAEAQGLRGKQQQDLLWLIRHALRHPDKKGEPRAVALRTAAGHRRKSASGRVPNCTRTLTVAPAKRRFTIRA